MFRFNKGFNITIIVISILIITATAICIGLYPDKFELIFGTGTFVYVSLGMFVSLQSLDTATGARSDSEKSAEATVVSADSARQALQLAMEEAARAKERYRIENSSLLKLHKGNMHIPVKSPFDLTNGYPNDDVYSNRNYDTIFLRNGGIGTASAIDVEVEFINDHEFNEFKFDTRIDKDGNDRVEPGRVRRFLWKAPHYKFEAQHFVNENLKGRIHVKYSHFSSEQKKMVSDSVTYLSSVDKSKRMGIQDKGDELPIRLPGIYSHLAHHFFMERKMLDEKEWITPNPRLRIRVTYTEDVLEHMNDHAEARRVKEFEISCNEDVRVMKVKEETEFGRYFLVCDFNIQTMFDRRLSALSIEESPEEETVDGSTESTEG